MVWKCKIKRMKWNKKWNNIKAQTALHNVSAENTKSKINGMCGISKAYQWFCEPFYRDFVVTNTKRRFKSNGHLFAIGKIAMTIRNEMKRTKAKKKSIEFSFWFKQNNNTNKLMSEIEWAIQKKWRIFFFLFFFLFCFVLTIGHRFRLS